MIVPIVLIIFIAVMVLYVILIWLRKFQYQGVYLNFKELEEKFHGRAVAPTLATRPFFKGQINGREISIGITTERKAGRRDVYIYFTIGCSCKFQLSVISRDWMKNRDENQILDRVVLDEKYLLQSKQSIPEKELKELKKIINALPDFAYILIAETGIILELISGNLIDDTSPAIIEKIIRQLNRLALTMNR